jgi:FkbM family methyltransferase
MKLFSRLVKPGTHVVEVGGHIGFISIFFMKLVGAEGNLTVFEPGTNNLPYIRRNIKAAKVLGAKTTLVEKAVGDRVGEITLFEEDLTGQNNSVIENFKGLEANAKMAFLNVRPVSRIVPVVTRDCALKDKPVDFIKIDVEGFEKYVLLGAKKYSICTRR